MESQLVVWETPDFEEVGVAPEVTMYIARWRPEANTGRRWNAVPAPSVPRRRRETGCGCGCWDRRLGAATRSGTAAARCAGRSARAPAGARTQSSIAVSADRARWFLFNASPDVRTQFEAFPGLRPRDDRTTPLAAVLLTDAELDHTLGLLLLREAARPAVARHPGGTQDAVRRLGVLSTLERYCPVEWRAVVPGPTCPWPGLPAGRSTSPPPSTTGSAWRPTKGGSWVTG